MSVIVFGAGVADSATPAQIPRLLAATPAPMGRPPLCLGAGVADSATPAPLGCPLLVLGDGVAGSVTQAPTGSLILLSQLEWLIQPFQLRCGVGYSLDAGA